MFGCPASASLGPWQGRFGAHGEVPALTLLELMVTCSYEKLCAENVRAILKSSVLRFMFTSKRPATRG